jgi:hypothetical protein
LRVPTDAPVPVLISNPPVPLSDDPPVKSDLTVVLALRDCIIYVSTKKKSTRELESFEVSIGGESKMIKLRPGLRAFLCALRATFIKVHIFTHATQDFADPILDALEEGQPGKYFDGRYYRQHCIYHDFGSGTPIVIKNLEKIQKEMKRIVYVGHNPEHFAHSENCIQVPNFRGGRYEDTVLDQLYKYLIEEVDRLMDVTERIPFVPRLSFFQVYYRFVVEEEHDEEEDVTTPDGEFEYLPESLDRVDEESLIDEESSTSTILLVPTGKLRKPRACRPLRRSPRLAALKQPTLGSIQVGGLRRSARLLSLK